MISEKVIMEKLREFAASSAGKKAIKEKHGVDFVPLHSRVAAARMSAIAFKARQILHRHISAVIDSIKLEDILIGEPFIDKTGMANITLSFKEVVLFRPSLQPSKYSRGIDDIVLHFTHGWNAKGAVFGSWHGANTWSRRAKLSDNFLQKALDEINLQIKNIAVAELKDSYKK